MIKQESIGATHEPYYNHHHQKRPRPRQSIHLPEEISTIITLVGRILRHHYTFRKKPLQSSPINKDLNSHSQYHTQSSRNHFPSIVRLNRYFISTQYSLSNGHESM